MKKTALLLCAALMALVSCHKEIIDTPAGHEPAAEITFNLSATHPGGDGTKAVKTGWETGDVIFVFFSGASAPAYLEMKWNGTGWEETPKNWLSLTDGESGTMRAVYLPFGSGLTVSADSEGNFVFSETQESYYLTATLGYTVEGSTVSGSFAMKVPEGYVQFFLNLPAMLAPYKAYATVELREPKLTPLGIASIAANGDITHTPIVHGAPLKGYLYNKEVKTGSEAEGYLFSGILDWDARGEAKDYRFTLYAKATSPMPPITIEKYYQKEYLANTLHKDDNTRRALLLPDNLSSWKELMDYRPIDLGCNIDLGGGVKRRIYWSSRNLGASSDFPTADTDDARKATWGDYYAWGAIQTHYEAGTAYDDSPTWKSGMTGYNWASCPFETAGDGSKFNKYTINDSFAESGTADGLTVLDRNDDAASQMLGGAWRMPTADEWRVLLSHVDRAWDNTNKGVTVTIEGGTPWTAPTIFLPAAGAFYLYTNRLSDQGNSCHYWSSSLNDINSFTAIGFTIGESGLSPVSYDRKTGHSIRPVMD